MAYGQNRTFDFKQQQPPQGQQVRKKHGVEPVETFLSINAVPNKKGGMTFIIDHTTRYLVDGKYLDAVVKSGQERAAQKLAKQVVGQRG